MWFKFGMTFFLLVHHTHKLVESRDLSNFRSMCKYLNVPIAHHKTHTLTFLGVELYTELMTAKLAKD